MLARLQDQGLVESRWESAGQVGGRPPRRYYQLTRDGIRIARLELASSAKVARATRRRGPLPQIAPDPVSGFAPWTVS